MLRKRTNKRRSLALCTTLLLVLAAVPAKAQVIDPPLEAVLTQLRPGEPVPVILTLSERLDPAPFRGPEQAGNLVRALQQKADRAQAPLTALLRQRGVARPVRLWAINGLAFSASPGLLRELAALPGVQRIGLDATLRKPETEPATVVAPEWNLQVVGAPGLWALGHAGEGTVVAGMDTGVDALHPDLAGNWRGGGNSWFDPNGQHPTPYDPFGHGTQTMGLAVGGSAGGTAIGVAPKARWIAVKIFDDAGLARLSGIHQGFQWLLDPDGDPGTDDAPDVVINAWDIPDTVGQCFTEFEADLQVLKAAGIAVVFAAGNHGPGSGTDSSPANNPAAFASGAIDQAQTIAYFSSRGPSACDGSLFPEVVAPGANVRTADLTYGGIIPDPYAWVSGTSFAAPHVAGAIALLRSAVPAATVTDLEQALAAAAVDIGQNGPDQESGYGLIDVRAALPLLQPAPACTDADADGYFAEAGCGTPQDCNDGDPGLHPGSAEIRHDGIDQDCNGYDLTIDISKADYSPRQDALTVEATSSLGASAALTVQGYGDMKWDRKKAKWTLTVRSVGGKPAAVTVAGIEGEVSMSIN